ncbi:MAG: YgaP-like transmembrane domain [Flavobacteriaceae bacterium]
MNAARNIKKVRAHDAICGILYLISVGLTIQTGNLDFLYIAAAVGVLQIISPFTKFCPVYYTLNKLMKDTDPMQNGK